MAEKNKILIVSVIVGIVILAIIIAVILILYWLRERDDKEKALDKNEVFNVIPLSTIKTFSGDESTPFMITTAVPSSVPTTTSEKDVVANSFLSEDGNSALIINDTGVLSLIKKKSSEENSKYDVFYRSSDDQTATTSSDEGNFFYGPVEFKIESNTTKKTIDVIITSKNKDTLETQTNVHLIKPYPNPDTKNWEFEIDNSPVATLYVIENDDTRTQIWQTTVSTTII